MFQLNDDLSIYATRGDIVFFAVLADDGDENPHQFQAGDVVRMKVFGKKKCGNVVLQKDFSVLHNTEQVEIFLTKEDMKIGEVISKPTDYWYEVELNPDTNPRTIIGYGEDGPAVLKLMPEGADLTEYIPAEEDIPFVDTELDLTSPRPVANKAIAPRLIALENKVNNMEYVTPQMYGAMGDGEADDTTALQAALNAAEDNGCVIIPKGTYMATSLVFNAKNAKIIMQGKIKQIAGHDGDLLTVKGRYIDIQGLNIERDCTQQGVAASEDLRNVGLKITESKNVNVHFPIIKNFNVGILAHSDNAGCAYIDIYSPQIIAHEGIKSEGAAWVNEIHVFGGRISIHETYTDYSGSSYLNLMGDCNRVFGMCLEGTKVERKIKGAYSNSLFIGCRFEGNNESGTDIEVNGGWNAFIHNRDNGEVIADNGEGNNFLDYAVYKFNSAIAKHITTFVSTATENRFDGSWKKPLVLADATAASMTIAYPTATNAYVKGVEFTVKKIDSSSNGVYVYARNDLDGAQVSLKKKNECITFFSDGTAWRIKDHYIPS